MDKYGELAAKALYVAQTNIGYGEEGKNNEGKFIKAIGGVQGDAWCAYFQSYCYKKAAELLNTTLPFKTSGGAKQLSKNFAAAGKKFTDPKLAKPGDLVCWNRGTISWQGHIGMVEKVDSEGIVHTIEGNTGNYPSKVKRLIHDTTKENLFQFSSLLVEDVIEVVINAGSIEEVEVIESKDEPEVNEPTLDPLVENKVSFWTNVIDVFRRFFK